MFNNIAAISIGVIISVMMVFNGSLSSLYGNYTSSVIIHGVGLIGMCLIVFIKKLKFKLEGIPWYLYLGGVSGVFTVLFTNWAFNEIGASLVLSMGLFGQSLSSIIADHYGIGGTKVNKFSTKKLIGLSLMIAGIVIMTIW